MPESIGGIEIPVPPDAGIFPFRPDYGSGMVIRPQIVVHRFASANAKIEQRFYLGDGAIRFQVRRERMRKQEYEALVDFWELARGAYATFTYHAPNPDGTTTAYKCHFENQPLSIEHFAGCLASVNGVGLIEVPNRNPGYATSATLNRFPDAALTPALLDQVQEVFPLIRIRVTDPAIEDIFLSDRRVTIDGTLYQPRLLDWQGIGQSLGEASDAATFILGNADRVFTRLTSSVSLDKAVIEFFLFHVATRIKIDLWSGYIRRWATDAGKPEFRVDASDGAYELTLAYPTFKITRECWKIHNDGKHCPWASASGQTFPNRNIRWTNEDGKLIDRQQTFTPAVGSCDQGYDSPNGCLAHGMERYFGGLLVRPQGVNVKDNSTGVWGFGRSRITSVSLVADSVYDQVLPEVYTDGIDLPVKCKIAAGRDEGDFYTALGIVSAGPITSFSSDLTKHLLDGSPPHDPQRNGGWRYAAGVTPANPQDKFGITQAPWGVLSNLPDVWSAGTAFAEIRKSDPKGLQLSRLTEHDMQVVVTVGMGGWVWTAPGQRIWAHGLTNPVWIAVNAYLKAIGYFIHEGQAALLSAADMEERFDMNAALAAAALCDIEVPKLIGTGTERQYVFRGVIQEEKPLREWLQEILNTCAGYFTFAFGKLRIGLRFHSGATEPFTEGNIVLDTLHVEPVIPSFNHITGQFGDQEYGWALNSVSLRDRDHALMIGGPGTPKYLKTNMTFVGVSQKSQAARLITMRLREELGGITPAEWRKARELSFKTTVLALNTEPGMICSLTHSDLPDGVNEFRVTEWKLNRDYSIDIQGRTTTDSMYDLTVGPKPADVPADPLPTDPTDTPSDWNFDVDTPGDGTLRITNLECKRNGIGVTKAHFEIWAIDEATTGYCRTNGGLVEDATQIAWDGFALEPGQYLLVNDEIILVTKAAQTDPGFGTADVARAQLGTTKNPHLRAEGTVTSQAGNVIITAALTQGAFRAGDRFFLELNPSEAEQLPIGEVNGNTVTLIRPLENTPAIGQICYSDPRVYPLRKIERIVHLQPRFFTSPNRAGWEEVFDLLDHGLVLIRAQLESVSGKRSAPITMDWTGDRKHTGGNQSYCFSMMDVPDGATVDAFEPLYTTEAGAFGSAYAEIRGTERLHPPAGLNNIAFGRFTPTGTISLSGEVVADNPLSVTIGDIEITVFRVTTETTLGEVADSLVTWLNADERFAQFYWAEPSSSMVLITEKTGRGGALAVQSDGSLEATATGLTSAMGILSGRCYAVSFAGVGTESDLSPLSPSTGPTGGAQQIELKDLPVSTQPDISSVRIWAAPDGADWPLYLVTTVSNGSTEALDTVAESDLANQQEWLGSNQPTGSGSVTIDMSLNGTAWLQLRIPDGAVRSNVLDGRAVGNVPEGALLNSSITADNPGKNLRILLS